MEHKAETSSEVDCALYCHLLATALPQTTVYSSMGEDLVLRQKVVVLYYSSSPLFLFIYVYS